MRAALSGLDEGEFTEGHELDRKWRVPKAMSLIRVGADQYTKPHLRLDASLLQ